MTCGEAAQKFRKWAQDAGYAIDRATLGAQAQVLEAFPADTPVPQKHLEDWNFER